MTGCVCVWVHVHACVWMARTGLASAWKLLLWKLESVSKWAGQRDRDTGEGWQMRWMEGKEAEWEWRRLAARLSQQEKVCFSNITIKKIIIKKKKLPLQEPFNFSHPWKDRFSAFTTSQYFVRLLVSAGGVEPVWEALRTRIHRYQTGCSACCLYLSTYGFFL